ncbi:MAG: putative beta-lysine N-acetyltransferase [Phycisphaerae bacterium]|nr:putative beta-lysine N-acetyltransferase [Phycisphaerae bacterium]
MPDVVTTLGGSLIQHGPQNDRIYVMKLDPRDLPAILAQLDDLAGERGYSKIFAKVPASAGEAFEAAGYEVEARAAGLFNGREDGLFVSRFVDLVRRDETDPDRHEAVLAAARAKRGAGAGVLPAGVTLRLCGPDDIADMAALYADVFDSYPFPIDDPAYLAETMASHVAYFGVWRGRRLAALGSAEMNTEAGNVEMTDFATQPGDRGGGLAAQILSFMEDKMRARGLATAYTIARAVSFGMNVTFARMNYEYGGRLVNNTHIAGRYESMNVWSKRL